MTRGLREILVEAAHAIADALEGKVRHDVAAIAAGEPAATHERSELDERNERMRKALNARAQGDLRELRARAKDRPLTDDEQATIAILSAGYRLMPAARDELKLTTPLSEPASRPTPKAGVSKVNSKRPRPQPRPKRKQ